MNVMVISPHADDETLGAGGTLIKMINGGVNVCWINVTNAKTKYGYTSEDEERGSSKVKDVAKLYGIQNFCDLQLEPAGLHKYDMSDLIDSFSKIIRQYEPNTMFLPYPGDIHSDHRVVFDAAFACTKTFRYPYIKKILCMEIISETDNAISDNGFVPNMYVDITCQIDKKIEIMKTYREEMGEPPFPRSERAIRGLASYRGAASYCEYAEAFRILKEIM